MRPRLIQHKQGFHSAPHNGVALPKIIAVWEKVSKVRPHISTSKMIPSKNSTDLDMGRRPKSKSDEFFGLPRLVIEIIMIYCVKPPKKVLRLFGASLLIYPNGYMVVTNNPE